MGYSVFVSFYRDTIAATYSQHASYWQTTKSKNVYYCYSFKKRHFDLVSFMETKQNTARKVGNIGKNIAHAYRCMYFVHANRLYNVNYHMYALCSKTFLKCQVCAS